jgi:hypothetical protein
MAYASSQTLVNGTPVLMPTTPALLSSMADKAYSNFYTSPMWFPYPSPTLPARPSTTSPLSAQPLPPQSLVKSESAQASASGDRRWEVLMGTKPSPVLTTAPGPHPRSLSPNYPTQSATPNYLQSTNQSPWPSQSHQAAHAERSRSTPPLKPKKTVVPLMKKSSSSSGERFACTFEGWYGIFFWNR